MFPSLFHSCIYKRNHRAKPRVSSEETLERIQSELLPMEWVRGDLIGRGSFGTVNLAIPKSQSLSQLMAVKSCGVSHSALLWNEKSILEELRDCQQIIQCFGGNLSLENGEKLYNVLLEFASGGALADKLKNSSNRRLPESEVRRYTNSILKGLQYIHKNGYVHCDLKLQNILLCSSEDCRDDVAKIADFGLAKKSGVKVGVELRGTPLYMSPETVSAGEQEAPADLWALGCLVAEMVTGAPAWRCPPEADICGLLMRIGVGDEVPEIPGNLSAEGKDFLGKCFVKDPRKRWTAEMLLNHPFVVDHADDDNSLSLEATCEASSWTSPRGPFDFPDWEVAQNSCSITSWPSPEYSWESNTWSSSDLNACRDPSSATSPAERLRQLAPDQRPDWSVSDSWVTVR